MRPKSWLLLVLALVGLAVLATALAYSGPRTTLLDPGEAGLFAPRAGFYALEEDRAAGLRYRWSDGAGTLLLPNPGGRLLLDLRLLDGPGVDDRVQLWLDDVRYDMTMAPGLRRYQLLSEPHAGEQIALRIVSVAVERNDRLLGVGLSTLRVRGGGAAPLWVAALVACLAALVGLEYGRGGSYRQLCSEGAGGAERFGAVFRFVVALLFVTSVPLWLAAGGWRGGLFAELVVALLGGYLLVVCYPALARGSLGRAGLGLTGAVLGLGGLVWLVVPPTVGPGYSLAAAGAAAGAGALLTGAGWPRVPTLVLTAAGLAGSMVVAPLLAAAEGQVVLLLALAGGLSLLAVLAERVLPPLPAEQPVRLRLERADWLLLLGILGASLLLRLPFLAAPDPVGDLEIAAGRMGQLWQRGLAGAYDPPGDYMPLRLYLLSGLSALAAAFGEPPSGQLSPLITVLIKLPQLLADLVAPLVIFAWSKTWLPRRRAALVGLLYALAPPVWINVAWWGQVDALLMLPLLLAVVLFERGQGRWSWACWMLALLIKPQAILLAPLVYVVTLRRYGSRGLVWGASVAGGVGALVVLPLALAGQFGNMLAAYTSSVGRFPRATAGAYNLWYLWLGPVARDTDPLLGTLSARGLGFILLGAVVALICGSLLVRSDGPARARAAALLGLAFFCLPTQIHERYIFLSLAFLSLSVGPGEGWVGLWLWAVLAGTLNILAELSGFVPIIDATLGRSPLRYAIAVGNLVALGAGLLALVASTRAVERAER